MPELVLPEFMSNGPDWWLARINFLLSGWGEPKEESLKAAYQAAFEKIPCTGSEGFRPCANCNELGFECGGTDRPKLYDEHNIRHPEILPENEGEEGWEMGWDAGDPT